MRHAGHRPVSTRSTVRGFSMIEVLVTLLIISLALLGTAGLQAYSMRLNQSGQFRTQAVFYVADLAERIEANKTAAVTGRYVLAAGNVAPVAPDETCINGPCNAEQLATFDLANWQRLVARNLPQASWQVCIDADLNGGCDLGAAPTNPINYLIRVSWVDRQTDTTMAGFDANSQVGAADGVAGGERFFYSATRTVFSN